MHSVDFGQVAPAGDMILGVAESQLVVLNAAGKLIWRASLGFDDTPVRIAISPDGRRAAVTGYRGATGLVDLEKRVAARLAVRSFNPSWGPIRRPARV